MTSLQEKMDLKIARARRAAKLQSAWVFENGYYPRGQWRVDVSQGQTILGYWEWVGVRIDMKDVGIEDN